MQSLQFNKLTHAEKEKFCTTITIMMPSTFRSSGSSSSQQASVMAQRSSKQQLVMIVCAVPLHVYTPYNAVYLPFAFDQQAECRHQPQCSVVTALSAAAARSRAIKQRQRHSTWLPPTGRLVRCLCNPASLLTEQHVLPGVTGPRMYRLKAAVLEATGSKLALCCCILLHNSVFAGAPSTWQPRAKGESVSGGAFGLRHIFASGLP
jgi:hypothetical protein